MAKKYVKPKSTSWVLLLQEFDIVVRARKGTENQVSDHFLDWRMKLFLIMVISSRLVMRFKI